MIFIWHPQTIIEHRNFINLRFLAAGLYLMDCQVLAFQPEFMAGMSKMLYQIDHPLLLQIPRIEDRAEHAAAHACSRYLSFIG
jgi:hypothetical protein